MVQQPAHSIIAELEDAVRGGSSAKRVETLRQVTDLFLNDGERLSDDQVKVFDDVLCLLIARVETRAKAELSKRLAPLDYAPFEVIQHLAWDDEIEVAGNVLANSSRLGTDALVEIASSKGQDHLLAISGRANLPDAVTDVIVDRGEGKVIRKLANNAGAKFSEARLFHHRRPRRRGRRAGGNPRPSRRFPGKVHCATCCAAPRMRFAPGCWPSRRPQSRKRSNGS